MAKKVVTGSAYKQLLTFSEFSYLTHSKLQAQKVVLRVVQRPSVYCRMSVHAHTSKELSSLRHCKRSWPNTSVARLCSSYKSEGMDIQIVHCPKESVNLSISSEKWVATQLFCKNCQSLYTASPCWIHGRDSIPSHLHFMTFKSQSPNWAPGSKRCRL